MEDGITLTGVLVTTAIISVIGLPLLMGASKRFPRFQKALGYIWIGLIVSFLLVGIVAASRGRGTSRSSVPESDWDQCMRQFESAYDCYEWGERPSGDY